MTTNPEYLTTKALGWLAAALFSGVPVGWSQSEIGCKEVELAFRVSIRVPDDAELAWEAAWPDASEQLQVWRAEGFHALTEAWRVGSVFLPELKERVEQLGLPPSWAYVAFWSAVENPFDPGAFNALEAQAFLESANREDDPRDVLIRAHRASRSSLPLDAWAKAVRTGLRLMENFDLPLVHVVEPGETVYSISRKYGIPPACLAAKNEVWDDIHPGLPVLIPQLAR